MTDRLEFDEESTKALPMETPAAVLAVARAERWLAETVAADRSAAQFTRALAAVMGAGKVGHTISPSVLNAQTQLGAAHAAYHAAWQAGWPVLQGYIAIELDGRRVLRREVAEKPELLPGEIEISTVGTLVPAYVTGPRRGAEPEYYPALPPSTARKPWLR
jgi:hypothetical protein